MSKNDVDYPDFLALSVFIVACAFSAWLTADTGCACSFDAPAPAADVAEE